MDFPLLEVIDEDKGEEWAERYFHGGHLKCPKCGADRRTAWIEGQTKCSRVVKYRCRACRKVYTVYHETVFAHKQIQPGQAILLLRGICKGESTASLALAGYVAIHEHAVNLKRISPKFIRRLVSSH
jgi:hypothetical protein